jgi:hypothetical protein
MSSDAQQVPTSYLALCEHLGVAGAPESRRRREVQQWLRRHHVSGMLAWDLGRKGFTVRRNLGHSGVPLTDSTRQPKHHTLR